MSKPFQPIFYVSHQMEHITVYRPLSYPLRSLHLLTGNISRYLMSDENSPVFLDRLDIYQVLFYGHAQNLLTCRFCEMQILRINLFITVLIICYANCFITDCCFFCENMPHQRASSMQIPLRLVGLSIMLKQLYIVLYHRQLFADIKIKTSFVRPEGG